MTKAYVHGYDPRENVRLQDQAKSLVDLLHSDTAYPPGSRILEAGCGVGAQTATLAAKSPGASIVSVDISEDSVAQAEQKVRAAGLTNVRFQQGDIFHLPFPPQSFDHVFVCFVMEHLKDPLSALQKLKNSSGRAERSRSLKATMGPPTFIQTAMPPMPRFTARSSCSLAQVEMR